MKKVAFVTGTRADYGKIKSLIRALEDSPDYEVYVFVCGMHLDERRGSTFREVLKDNYKNTYIAYGLNVGPSMSLNVGDTIAHLTGYISFVKPDMIVVHGDRGDALAGAIVGALNNIYVAHIEGGEVSGTIDESIRHAISKFAHFHFVANDDARRRLLQLGEESQYIYTIGSPDIDVMMSDSLPSLEATKERYLVPFDRYGIVMYHPVVTEQESIPNNIKTLIKALKQSEKSCVIVYPNNDLGSDIIVNEYRSLENDEHFRLFPSIRFEYFLTLLKNCDFILGNSSAGIREASIYGVPAIDVGTRQNARYKAGFTPNIQHVSENTEEILQAIEKAPEHAIRNTSFGEGDSTERFLSVLSSPDTWERDIQKHFCDLEFRDND